MAHHGGRKHHGGHKGKHRGHKEGGSSVKTTMNNPMRIKERKGKR